MTLLTTFVLTDILTITSKIPCKQIQETRIGIQYPEFFNCP